MRCRSFCLLLMLLCGMLPTPAIGQKLSAYSAARQTRLSSAQLRIDAALRQTSSLVKQYGSTAASRMVTRAVQLRQDGVMDVYVHVNPLTSTQLQMLRQHAIRIQRVDWQAHIVYASVSVDALETIAALDFVRWVGPPSYAKRRTGSVTSEGDQVLMVEEARERFAVAGRDVRIGIISDSLIDWQDAFESGDLPFFRVGNCVDFAAEDTSCIFAGQDGSGTLIPGQVSTDEGRAMAEIIHDLAPASTLIFHSGLSTSVDMRAAIQALIDAEVDIVVDDLGFPAEPVFEDGPVAQQVQAAIDSGVVYVTATGNDAQSHYRGMYQEFDPNDNDPNLNLHDFGAGDTTMALTIGPGHPGHPGTLTAFLQWADRFDGSANTADYDLLLLDAAGRDEACNISGLSGVCISDNRQLQSQAPPLESVTINNTRPEAVTVTLLINRVAGPALPLAINFLGNVTVLEHQVAASSIYGHPCIPGALAVGAIDVADEGFDTIEPYSSHGPCDIVLPAFAARSKPDLIAADGVMTSMANFNPFFGTSAAAPHVAAIAALLMDFDRQDGRRDLSPTQIVDVLRVAAVDLGETGIDPIFGYGKVDAVRVIETGQDLQAMTNRAPRSSIVWPADDLVVAPGTAVTFQGVCTDMNVEDGDTLTLHWDFGALAPASDRLLPGDIIFSSPGTFPITFTCSDAAGNSTSTRRNITVDQPPVGRIDAPSAPLTVRVGDHVDFVGSCRDTENHTPFTFLWTFGGGAERDRATQQNPQVLFDTPGIFTVTFNCTDALGIADAAPPTIQVTVARADSGGGGCGISPAGPFMWTQPLAALGNIFLPLVVMLGIQVVRRFRFRDG
jgi:subtilisin family serine protease